MAILYLLYYGVIFLFTSLQALGSFHQSTPTNHMLNGVGGAAVVDGDEQLPITGRHQLEYYRQVAAQQQQQLQV